LRQKVKSDLDLVNLSVQGRFVLLFLTRWGLRETKIKENTEKEKVGKNF